MANFFENAPDAANDAGVYPEENDRTMPWGDATIRLVDAWADGMRTWARVFAADDNSSLQDDFESMRGSYINLLSAWQGALGSYTRRGYRPSPAQPDAQSGKKAARIRLGLIRGKFPSEPQEEYVEFPKTLKYPVTLSLDNVPKNVTVTPRRVTSYGNIGLTFAVKQTNALERGTYQGELIGKQASGEPVVLGSIELRVITTMSGGS